RVLFRSLKHPLIRLGRKEGAFARAIAALETAILRGPRPQAGTAGLAQALATFRSELGKLRRKEASELHPAEPPQQGVSRVPPRRTARRAHRVGARSRCRSRRSADLGSGSARDTLCGDGPVARPRGTT